MLDILHIYLEVYVLAICPVPAQIPQVPEKWNCDAPSTFLREGPPFSSAPPSESPNFPAHLHTRAKTQHKFLSLSSKFSKFLAWRGRRKVFCLLSLVLLCLHSYKRVNQTENPVRHCALKTWSGHPTTTLSNLLKRSYGSVWCSDHRWSLLYCQQAFRNPAKSTEAVHIW